jgi:hypothetical protein
MSRGRLYVCSLAREVCQRQNRSLGNDVMDIEVGGREEYIVRQAKG